MHLLRFSLLLAITAGLSWGEEAGEKDATVTRNLQLMSSRSPQSYGGGCLHPLKQQDGAAALPALLQAGHSAWARPSCICGMHVSLLP